MSIKCFWPQRQMKKAKRTICAFKIRSKLNLNKNLSFNKFKSSSKDSQCLSYQASTDFEGLGCTKDVNENIAWEPNLQRSKPTWTVEAFRFDSISSFRLFFVSLLDEFIGEMTRCWSKPMFVIECLTISTSLARSDFQFLWGF